MADCHQYRLVSVQRSKQQQQLSKQQQLSSATRSVELSGCSKRSYRDFWLTIIACLFVFLQKGNSHH